MDGARHLNFFSDLPFTTVLADSRLESVIGRPLDIRVVCGNQRYLFVGDSKGRVHLIGPDRLYEQPCNFQEKNDVNRTTSQQLLCSIQLFGGRQCSILAMEILDIPNENGPGYTTNLFAICGIETHSEAKEISFAYQIYQLIPPLNSLYLMANRPAVSKPLLQPLVLVKEASLSKMLTGSDFRMGPGGPRSSAFEREALGATSGLVARFIPTASVSGGKNEEIEAYRKCLLHLTCVAVSDCLTYLVLGASTGDVVICTETIKPTKPSVKPRRLVPDTAAPITCVVLTDRQDNDRAEDGIITTYLFVATTISFSCYMLQNAQTSGVTSVNQAQPTLMWQDTTLGCSQKCIAWIPELKQCVVAVPTALYFFDCFQGNVSAVSSEGIPRSLSYFKDSQAVLCLEIRKRAIDSTANSLESCRRLELEKPFTDGLLVHQPTHLINGLSISSSTPYKGSSFLIKVISFDSDAKFVTCTRQVDTIHLLTPALRNIFVVITPTILNPILDSGSKNESEQNNVEQPPEGFWLLEHSLPKRIRTLARKGFWRWALRIARKEDESRQICKLIYRLYFMTVALKDESADVPAADDSNGVYLPVTGSNPTDALELFESSIMDDESCGLISFEDFLSVLLGHEVGVGSPQNWLATMKCLVRCLIRFHERGYATAWHTNLLLESLINMTYCASERASYDTRTEFNSVILVPQNVKTECIGDLISQIYGSDEYEKITVEAGTLAALMVAGALDNFKKRGCLLLGASLHLCVGNIEDWMEWQSAHDIKCLGPAIKLLIDYKSQLALACLKRVSLLTPLMFNLNNDSTITTPDGFLNDLHRLRRLFALSEQYKIDEILGDWWSRLKRWNNSVIRPSLSNIGSTSNPFINPDEDNNNNDAIGPSGGVSWDLRSEKIKSAENELRSLLGPLRETRLISPAYDQLMATKLVRLLYDTENLLEFGLFKWLLGRARSMNHHHLKQDMIEELSEMESEFLSVWKTVGNDDGSLENACSTLIASALSVVMDGHTPSPNHTHTLFQDHSEQDWKRFQALLCSCRDKTASNTNWKDDLHARIAQLAMKHT